jgi:hypothetical protein
MFRCICFGLLKQSRSQQAFDLPERLRSGRNAGHEIENVSKNPRVDVESRVFWSRL